MTWKKMGNNLKEAARRSVPCVSRNRKNPDIAYVMMPVEMAKGERVSVYHDGGSRIALEFGIDGDFVVRRASHRSYSVRVTIPKKIAHVIPFGLRDVSLQPNGEGLWVIDL